MRSLFRILLTLFGLVCLVLGGYLLYTVYIDTPETRVDILGGASQRAQDAVDNGLAVTVDGDPSGAELIGVPEVDVNTAIVRDGNEASAVEPSLSANEVEIASRNIVSDQAIAGTTLDQNPAIQNEVISEDTKVQVIAFEGAKVDTIESNPDGQGGATIAEPGTYEQRVAEFEWPKVFREGETSAVRITIRPLESGGIQATAEITGNSVVATPIVITNYYNTHNAFVTAGINAPDFEVNNVNSARQQMLPGQEVSWRWNLTPKETGNFTIALGIEVFWEAKPGSGQVNIGPFPVWGQVAQTQVDQVFGLISIPTASFAGTVLAVLGALAQIPFVAEFAKEWFENRMEKMRKNRRSNKA